MSGRFSRPVLPGETLVISIWVGDGGTAQFQTAKEDGTVVIDRGTVRSASRPVPRARWTRRAVRIALRGGMSGPSAPPPERR